MRVRAFSLNRGEVEDLPQRPTRLPVGWDLAGLSNASRTMPPARLGTRVVGHVRFGSWAQLVAVATTALAPIPDAVSDVQAATLPTAGLTALCALEAGGSVLGRRVLVTGANGASGGSRSSSRTPVALT